MTSRLLFLAVALSLSLPGFARAEFSYDLLQMGFQQNRIGVDELDTDLRSDGVLLVYAREFSPAWFVYNSLNAGTLENSVRMQNYDLHFNGTLISANAGIGRHWALADNADIHLKAGLAHSRYDLKMRATDISSEAQIQSRESDDDTGLHLEAGSRIYLNSSRSLEFNPYIGLTSLRGDTDTHTGFCLGLQTAPRIQLQWIFDQSTDNELQSFGMAVRVSL
ncbi:MAG: hypothetical protein H7A09_03800 [Oceanospirillaceae bacterium]|nr:hypothetical protein [Oceanospirillaceae bacterium]MCP5350395.1 hypothetical protein [Oceanospirillaceae bacterium]